MGVMLEKSRLADDLLDVVGHLAGGLRGGMALGIILRRRADGRDHRHRRRHGDHARPADAADAPPARLRPGARLRRDLRLRHARSDHSAKPDPDPARRHHAAIGGHAVRRGGDARACCLPRIYCIYILGLGVVAPKMVPAVPAERARARLARASSAASCCASCCRRSAWCGAVLGSIIGGVAAPTEAASMGALGAIARHHDRPALLVAGAERDTVQTTTKITAMMMFILICAQVFALAFRGLQRREA